MSGRRPPRRSRAALSATLLVLALPCGALAAVTQKATTVGSAVAQSALIKRDDLGAGWSAASAAPRKVPSLTCSSFNPSPHVAETGRAASPTWQQSSSGPFVSEATYAYASPAQAARVWDAVVKPRLAGCVAQALIAGSGRGVRFMVDHKQEVGMPSPGVRSARYRVHGTATSSGQSVDVYLDMIVLGRGPTIAALSVSSFEAPVALKLELRLARAAARRLPRG